MKNLKKAEFAAIGITLLCLVFTAGYFVGRSSGAHVISFDALPMASIATATIAMDNDNAPSAAGSNAVAAESAVSADRLNVNTASASELCALPGIGTVLAQNIIDYRVLTGGFKTIEQLKDVDGIGDKKYAAIKDLITVG